MQWNHGSRSKCKNFKPAQRFFTYLLQSENLIHFVCRSLHTLCQDVAVWFGAEVEHHHLKHLKSGVRIKNDECRPQPHIFPEENGYREAEFCGDFEEDEDL